MRTINKISHKLALGFQQLFDCYEYLKAESEVKR